MFDLFGPEIPLAAKFFIAFAVVLALIGLTAWLVRRFSANRLGGGTRGRQPRLAVIDAATVDGRRRLVLIRRDNVEHLLMIGGPTDVVVEPNIVRAVGARDLAREPGRVSVSPEPATRQTPNGDGSWSLQPLSEPTTVLAPRPSRSSATEEPWLPPEPGARARPADSLTGLAAELSTRLNPPEVAAPTTRSEPAPRPSFAPVVPPPPPAEPLAPAQTDHNLAEMAQQLEAALRRAPIPESRPPVTDPLAAPPAKAAPARDYKPRIEPKFELNREPKLEPKFELKIETKLEPPVEQKAEPKLAPTPGKAAFDNLEEEMASLLGRPPGKK
ncbi:MAG TPA: flagellar biosynthetic protein FliO [Pseudolabrys sp.]|nr:flagellar biosynthetic protein FliO [Pseudolabrys sp.]